MIPQSRVRCCSHSAPLWHRRSASACLSACKAAAPAVAALRERVLREVEWITEMSAIEMPWGHGEENVATSLNSDGGSVWGRARACSKEGGGGRA
jgi:hypothetical protein